MDYDVGIVKRKLILPGSSGFGTRVTVSSSSYDPDTQAWIDAVKTAGGSVSSTSAGYVDTLVTDLKGYSLFSSISYLLLLGNADADEFQSLVNLANPGSAATKGGTYSAYAANVGYTGDGSSFYIDTGFSPATAGMDQDDFGFTVWILSAPSTGGMQPMGMQSTGPLYTYMSNKVRARLNTDGGTAAVGSTNTGLFTGVRTASTTAAIYENGSSTPTDTDATTSAGVATGNTYIFAGNDNGSADSFIDAQMCIAAIHTGFTGSQVANFHTALNTYMTSLGHGY
jgi:hypothetical protein